MIPTDEYSFNDLDGYLTYGWIMESGGRDLIRPPKLKDPLSLSWPDQNGTQYDLSVKYFEEKNITITGVILGTSIADFFAKEDAFFTMWAQPGTIRLYKKSYDRSFYVFMKDCTNVTEITKFKEYGQMIGMRYSISICEPVPNFAKPFNLLVDEDNNYFTDGDGNRILMDISA